MTAVVRFSPLYGTTEDEPLCYLLEIDEYTMLLDCGWNNNFDTNLLEPLKQIAPKIDAVLLTYPDLPHLGAIPYAVGKLGLNCPIYATIPTFQMGQMFLYDAFQARYNQEEFDLFTVDEIDLAFEKFVQLKYQQKVYLEGKGEGIELLPLNAGHMIGGTFWRIKKETEEIIYAVDYNQRKERHLNGTVLESVVKKPTLMITDAYTMLTPYVSRSAKDNELLESINRTIKAGGNVLIPCDSSGRVLELLPILDNYWLQQKITNASVAFVSYESFNTVDFAKSQLEWMNDSVMNAFNAARQNPFQLKCVHLCKDLERLNQLPSPKVVLASMPDLESGFSRQLFVEFASNPDNLIFFVEKPIAGTLGRSVLDGVKKFEVSMKKRVPLQGTELEEYFARKKLEEEAKKRKEFEKNKKSKIESDSEDESDDELSKKVAFQSGMDYTIGRFAQEGFRHAMFPYQEKHSLFDDYGEITNEKDFLNEPMIDENGQKIERPSDKMMTDYEEPEETPTKCISYTVNVTVQSPVQYTDFSGRSDSRSIKTILEHIAPRKMIIVHGSEEAKQSLSTHVSKIMKSVYVPKAGEMLDVAFNSSAYKLKLKDTVLNTLQMHKVAGYNIAWINGALSLPERLNETDQPIPALNEAAENAIPGHRAIFIGEVSLANFKEVLQHAGYRADFVGGVLVTADGTIALRKEEVDGLPRIKIEGVISADYFKIRQLLYSQYIIL